MRHVPPFHISSVSPLRCIPAIDGWRGKISTTVLTPLSTIAASPTPEKEFLPTFAFSSSGGTTRLRCGQTCTSVGSPRGLWRSTTSFCQLRACSSSSSLLHLPGSSTCLVGQLGKTCTLNGVVMLEQVARQLAQKEDYGRFVQQCEVHLCELCHGGAVKLSEIRRLLYSRSNYDWHTLSLAIGCSVHLLEKDTAYIEWVVDFLSSATHHPSWRRVGCTRFQAYVSVLLDNFSSLSLNCILKGLASASLMDELRDGAHRLLAAVEKSHCKSFACLSPHELEWLALAGRQLYVHCGHDHASFFSLLFEKVIASRFVEFSPEQGVNVLVHLQHVLVKYPDLQSTVKNFPAFEEHLAMHASLLTDDLLMELSTVFKVFGYKSCCLPFKEALLRRLDGMSQPDVASLLNYILCYYTLDDSNWASLLDYLPVALPRWQPRELIFFLSSLCSIRSDTKSGPRAALQLVQREITQRLSLEPGSFSPDAAARILYYTTLLRVCTPAVSVQLFRFVAGEFSELALSVKAQCLYALSVLEENAHLVSEVHNLLHSSKPALHKMTLTEAVQLCFAFVNMRLCVRSWLIQIGDLCAQNLHTFVAEHQKEFRDVFVAMSMLNFVHHWSWVFMTDWMDSDSFVLMLQSDPGYLIDLLWACAVSERFPQKAVEELARQSLRLRNGNQLSLLQVQRLLQINAVRRLHTRTNLLGEDVIAELLRCVRSNRSPLPIAIEVCANRLRRLFPQQFVQTDVFVYGTWVTILLLKDGHGKLIKWPHLGGTPSAEHFVSLRSLGYDPVAVLVFGPKWFFHNSSVPLATTVMCCRTLAACGLRVLLINADHIWETGYVPRCFSSVGILLSTQAVRNLRLYQQQ